MKQFPLLKEQNGFTVTETMIALAAGGLILLLVLLAVPALTRNSRNNQRRQDVNIILQAVSHYELTDSGTFPKNCGGIAPACNVDAGGSSNDYFLKYDQSKLTYYTDFSQSQIILRNQSAGTSPSQSIDIDHVRIYNYQKCDTVSFGHSTAQGAGYNDVVAIYAFETSGNISRQCQQL